MVASRSQRREPQVTHDGCRRRVPWPAAVDVEPVGSAVVPADSKGTQLVLSSADKAQLVQLAASIRDLRPPEPYGGKGIRYRGENIRRKAGKAAKGKGK